MRNLLRLILTGTVGLTTSCASGLWGPFTQDTDSNCNVTPDLCATGQTCNLVTGLCEGGSLVDMTLPPPTEQPFQDEQVITIQDGKSYENMALGDITKSDKLDILLSAFSMNTLLVLSGDEQFDASKTQNYMLDSSQYPTHLVSLTGSPTKDILAATAQGMVYLVRKNGQSPMSAGSDAGVGQGYLLIDVGYADDDQNLDVIVTSSKLALPMEVLGVSTGTGFSKIFFGPINFAGPPTNKPIDTNNLIFTAARRMPLGLGVALSQNKPNNATLRILPVKSSSTFGTSDDQTPMPLNDFAIPTDLDNDGDLDLVLIKTFNISNSITPGLINVKLNEGSADTAKFVQDPIFTDSSGVIGAQVEDYDGDGYPDIIIANYIDKKIVIFHNLDKGTHFVKSFELLGTFGARVSALQDLDGDGCKDLIALFSGNSKEVDGTQIKIVHGRLKQGGTCP